MDVDQWCEAMDKANALVKNTKGSARIKAMEAAMELAAKCPALKEEPSAAPAVAPRVQLPRGFAAGGHYRKKKEA